MRSSTDILFPMTLLHTIGGGGLWDEIFLFGGIGIVLLTLGAFSWWEGSKKRKSSKRRDIQ